MDWRLFLKVQSVGAMFALSLITYLIWAVAYIHDYQTTVYVNRYGERLAELLLFHLVVIPVIAAGLALLVDDGN